MSNTMVCDLPLLIMGCGRSGTKAATAILRQCGLRVGHERPGPDGMSNWKTVPQLVRLVGKYKTRIHLVRTPLDCIASCQTMNRKSWKYIERHAGISHKRPLLVRCAMYWYRWNIMVQPFATARIRVETMHTELPRICFGNDHHKLSLKIKDKDVHSRRGKYRPVAWSDIVSADAKIANACRALALRYGYEV